MQDDLLLLEGLPAAELVHPQEAVQRGEVVNVLVKVQLASVFAKAAFSAISREARDAT